MMKKIIAFSLFILLMLFKGNSACAISLQCETHVGNQSNTMSLEVDWSDLEIVINKCERLQNEGKLTQMGTYYVGQVKTWDSNDDELLLALAKLTNNICDILNKYNWSLATNTNMNNFINNMSESYTLTSLDLELKTLRVHFALKASQLGNTEAKQLLQLWQIQSQIKNSANGNLNNNNSNNSSRINQLLNNIATYEKRIREVETQIGSGITTRIMGNQIISSYQQMIEDAKQDLRNLGYSIY